MIHVNSENKQNTIITLTETELKGIYGSWGHDNNHQSDFYRGDRFCWRRDERFGLRGGERFSYSGSNNCW